MLILTALGYNITGHKQHDTGSLRDLLSVTAQAIAEVFIICAVGYIGGKKGAIDAKTKRTLNKLNQSIFTPALLFGKVAFTLTPAKLGELWIVPVGFVIVSVVSALVAWGMGFMFRLSRSQRAFAIACATFMNSNSLPIALMQSLTYTVDGLKWGTQDTRDAMLGRALSYLVLFSTLGIILRWSYGIQLLSTADDDSPKDEEAPVEVLERDDANPSSGTLHSETQRSVAEPLLEEDENEDVEAIKTTGNDNDGVINTTVIDSNGNGNGVTSDTTAPRKTSRFVEGPVTVARPPNIQTQRIKPARRWTALGSRGDIGDVEYFGRSLSSQERTRIFRQEFSNFRSFPNTPTRTPAASSYASSGSDNDDDDDDETDSSGTNAWRSGDDENGADAYEGIGRRHGTAPSRSAWQSKLRRSRRTCTAWIKRKIWHPLKGFWKSFNNFMTAPLYAALLSLIVACIRPVQLFLDELLPVRNAIKSAGNCSVPITLIVLGSYFVEEPQPVSHVSKRKSALKNKASTASSLRHKFTQMFSTSNDGGDYDADNKNKPGENRTVFVSVVSRMIVAPLLLLPLLAWWTIKTQNIADDPVFIVTATLVIGSAPAITLAQMTTAVGNSFERLISKTLFVSYVIVTFPSTIALVLIGLEIAERQ